MRTLKAAFRSCVQTDLLQALFTVISVLLFSGTVTFFFRSFYYKIFPWVLSKNVIFPKGTLTPWIEAWSLERDGIEIFILYILMFVITGVVAVSICWLLKFRQSKYFNRILLLSSLLSIAFLKFCVKFYSGVGFAPPGLIFSTGLKRGLYCSLLGILVLFLLYLQQKISRRAELVLACLILIPFCFISTSPIAISNYVYIFSPAQKILEGVRISQIYFQYDFMLSALAALWMKTGFKLSLFQIIGQASNYAAILAVFLLSRKLFLKKELSFLFFISLVLVKITSAPWDPAYLFQVTSLRLDLWILPLAAIFLYGYSHWLTTFILGGLILIHGAFGLIYTIGYLQLIITLEFFAAKNLNLSMLLERYFKGHLLRKTLPKVLFLFVCFVIARVVFGKSIEAVSWYQKIGIGFIPLGIGSFFWIYPAIVASAFSFLVFMRNSLSSRYFSVGIILVYFTIGNCIYFFGRSHELNLFSISIPLLFLFFYMLDLFDRWLGLSSRSIQSKLGTLLAFSFVMITSFACFDVIKSNVRTQIKQGAAFKFQTDQDLFTETEIETDLILKELRGKVGGAVPIAFMILSEGDEFYFYQKEKKNSIFCYPFASCIFLSGVIEEAQAKLDNGDLILVDQKFAANIFEKKLSGIKFRYTTKSGKYLLLGKQEIITP